MNTCHRRIYKSVYYYGQWPKTGVHVAFWPKTDVPENNCGRECCWQYLFFSSFFSLISLIADGPHHYHPACGH